MEDIKNFETQFARLQAIVSELETGATSLEKGMALYREGLLCSRACRNMLENARHELHKWQNGEEVPLPLKEDLPCQEEQPSLEN